MPSDARGLIDEARSLADLQNTKNITYADELNLINEAWRELYSRYTEAGGDYFLGEYDFTLQASWKDSAVAAGTDWLIPLPADFYKIRFLDWFTGGQWRAVDVFSISQRNFTGGEPRYRLRGNTLWLIVPPGVTSQFRLVYYIPPAAVSAPDAALTYGANIADFNKPLCTWPTWAATDETMVYVYNGLQIIAESTDKATVTTLFTAGAAVTRLRWYKGYLYWIQGANIYRAPTDLVTSPLVPVAVVSGGVTSLSIWNDLLYWIDGSGTHSSNLDGTGSVLLNAASWFDFCQVLGLPVFLSALPGNLMVNGVAVLANIQSVTSDGTYLFVLDAPGNASRLTISTAGAVTATSVLSSGVRFLRPISAAGTRLPVILQADSSMAALSAAPNTVFTFPSNEVSEIMAYLCAVAFARKSGDGDRMAKLSARLDDPQSGLWARFAAVNLRDEYQAQRVNDGYANSRAGWY